MSDITIIAEYKTLNGWWPVTTIDPVSDSIKLWESSLSHTPQICQIFCGVSPIVNWRTTPPSIYDAPNGLPDNISVPMQEYINSFNPEYTGHITADDIDKINWDTTPSLNMSAIHLHRIFKIIAERENPQNIFFIS